MRSSIILMLRKVAVLFLILVIGMTSFVTPASASMVSEKEPFVIELAKEVTKELGKTATAFLVPPAICLLADTLAAGIFPPVAVLAPYCATLAIPFGTASAVGAGATGTINIAKEVMAY
jgi:hypothetical protein